MFAWISLIIQQAYAQSTFMPTAGSAVAAEVDDIYWLLLLTSGISFVLVIGGLFYFALKYKRKSDSDKTAYITHNNFLEFLWSFIPFVFFLIFFVWGWKIYDEMRTFPEDALELHVTGQKWSWNFEYKSGRKLDAEFYVPVDTPVKLILASNDVLHSFFVPGMRIKQDVVPGRYTAVGFTANKVGSYQVFCTEFCGDQHSSMLAKMHVVPVAEFEAWLAKDLEKELSLAQIGEKLFKGKCLACHSAGKDKKVGPGLAGVFGSERSFEEAGSLVADENYIRESMMNPQKKIVKGYKGQFMSSFQGQLKEKDIKAIIEFLKTLK